MELRIFGRISDTVLLQVNAESLNNWGLTFFSQDWKFRKVDPERFQKILRFEVTNVAQFYHIIF